MFKFMWTTSTTALVGLALMTVSYLDNATYFVA